MGSKLSISNSSPSDSPPLPQSLSNVSHITTLIPSLYPSLARVQSLIHHHSHIKYFHKRHDNLLRGWGLIRSTLSEVENDFSNLCRTEWDSLNTYDGGLVCSHTLAVVACAYLSNDFKALDQHDQSLVMWGCFFHDIAKRGRPAIKGKDPIHPFTSAARALKILDRLGLVPASQEVDETVQVINNAFVMRGRREFMDNGRMAEIMRRLLYVTGVISEKDEEFTSYFELTREMERG